MNNTSTSWPSLYNPAFELRDLLHRPPELPNGHYLHDPNDVFRFTLYWSFVFYLPPFIFCGLYAALNLAFPPTRQLHPTARVRQQPTATSPEAHLLLVRPPTGASARTSRSQGQRPRVNERRSRATFALLVLATYIAAGFAGAIIASVVGGFIIAGLYSAGHYNISTWVPCICAFIQSLVGTLGIWPKSLNII
ncbi:hypothetical protein PUNSTDRAFT_93648 [Punctularia strigosozonata HHB-11173 SS5]|uniref:Integral membrane protein n=1 Tax=Punctularia strigosozonata (strain HHB-11173) TaxID=741275 RepID=R7S3T4_PUNST|nr:uncharacterized protein PUNSTDRAFT_93648 [Punctularia strigosozonata HHB-11173 SS5]EIN03891.1 hypothetical protein PUNSTDRAFT_93648 [Punctularia strigosozonata HHB-11173 SS5]